jgi:hypothetical protein
VVQRKRYLLFADYEKYPEDSAWGWNSLAGSYETLHEAQGRVQGENPTADLNKPRFQIVDIKTLKLVYDTEKHFELKRKHENLSKITIEEFINAA